MTGLTRSFCVDRWVVPVPPGRLRNLVTRAMAGFVRWEDRRHNGLPGGGWAAEPRA